MTEMMYVLPLAQLDADLATFAGVVGVPGQHIESSIPVNDWITLGRPGEVEVVVKPYVRPAAYPETASHPGLAFTRGDTNARSRG